MQSIFLILGGLGVFLYGLRIMSTGLQQVAGDRLRAVLATVTRNRVSGIFAGFLVTSIIQSSSATTVMIVSFANAGLLNLVQAIGPVMGANIGTTVTGWLVSLLGFKVKIDAFALPVIGVGFPLSFLDSHRARQWSQVLVGFGLLFLGLKFLKDGVPDLHTHPDQLAFLQHWSQFGFWSVLLFIAVGTILTIVVQSSSATMAITLTMAAAGWIDFQVAAAMVLGENIGTTITAALAAMAANRTAKRVARVHTVFNLIGVLWVVPLLGPILSGIDWLVPGNPMTDPMATPTHLAAFHTVFNVTNTLLLVWFVPQLERLARWLVPVKDGEEEGSHLEFLHAGLLSAPETAVLEVRRALQRMVGVVTVMFGQLREVLDHPDAKLGKVVDEIKRGEAKTDEMEAEIVGFCAELAEAGASHVVGETVTRSLEMAGDIERMGDHCMNLVLLAQRRYDKKMAFSEAATKDLREMTGYLVELLEMAHRALDPGARSKVKEAQIVERKVNLMRDRARKRHAEKMQRGEFPVRQGLVFLDMMNNLERLGDYCINVAEAAEPGSGRSAA